MAGVPFTALSQILPFILIGIGVDDMVSQRDVLWYDAPCCVKMSKQALPRLVFLVACVVVGVVFERGGGRGGGVLTVTILWAIDTRLGAKQYLRGGLPGLRRIYRKGQECFVGMQGCGQPSRIVSMCRRFFRPPPLRILLSCLGLRDGRLLAS